MPKRWDVVAQLEDLAAWFENPQQSKFYIVCVVGERSYTPAFLLRQIALAIEKGE